jgi:hypothetical protein
MLKAKVLTEGQGLPPAASATVGGFNLWKS